MTDTLELEPAGEKTYVCDCCGETSRHVWGWVHEGEPTRCCYFVSWAEGGGPHPPHVTLGYGPWGEGWTAADRASIYAELEDGRVTFVDHPAPGAPPDQADVVGVPALAATVEAGEERDDVLETIRFILRADDRIRF